MAKGNRFSSLPVAQFCAKSAALNVGAGRAAAISSVFHKRCAGDDSWKDDYARLTDEEQAEVDAMKYPATILLGDGIALAYEQADVEVPMALGEHCSHLPKGHPDAITEGTPDMYWVVDGVAYVGDIKRTEWTAHEGPRSLQIIGYALAVCAMLEHLGHGMKGYVTGVWAAQEGLWSWGEYTALDSQQCAEDWRRVRAAALNVDGDFSTGPHCRQCYSRQRCPAYLVPPDTAHEGLTKYLTGQLTNDTALHLRRLCERVEETLETCKAELKAYVDANGGISDPEAGKVYAKVAVKGRVVLDRKALENDQPELVQKYMREGAPSQQYRWVNERKKP